MSVILGINTFHAGASAALLVDGQPIVALAEERLNRVKYFAGFPKLAVSRCLEIAGLSFSDIDAVAVGRDSSANLHKKLEFAIKNIVGVSDVLINNIVIRSNVTSFDNGTFLVQNKTLISRLFQTISGYVVLEDTVTNNFNFIAS